MEFNLDSPLRRPENLLPTFGPRGPREKRGMVRALLGLVPRPVKEILGPIVGIDGQP